MSAEQADMSWPLLGDDADSPLRSTVFAQDASVLDLPPMSAKSDKQSTPQTGDKTQFFDCTISSFELSPLQSRSVVSQPTNSTRLVQPTKNLFEAQNEHTKALVEEVKLYRDLASSLHAEVVERDSVLADLNGRVLDTEMLKSQVGDLRDEVEKLRASSPGSGSREMSASPLAAKSTHAGDRTTVVQAETRDLEIRLSKALADQEMLQKQMDEVRHQAQSKDQELEETRRAFSELEDRHRDHLISTRQSPTPVDTRELDEALERCADLEFELTRATDLAQDLKDQMENMRQVKASDEEEIDRLNIAVEGSRDSKRSEDDMRLRLEEMERRVDAEMRRREEMEIRVQEERDARKRLEVENREVSPFLPLRVLC
jgi:chromosome segregation ATPase